MVRFAQVMVCKILYRLQHLKKDQNIYMWHKNAISQN